jgi:hypothetical protein
MAEVKTITVWTDMIKRPGIVSIGARQIVFWSCLVGAEAASHLLFGGSFVIDIIIIAIVAMVSVSQIQKMSGYRFDMTQDEIKRWAADGAPLDILAWRERSKRAS